MYYIIFYRLQRRYIKRLILTRRSFLNAFQQAGTGQQMRLRKAMAGLSRNTHISQRYRATHNPTHFSISFSTLSSNKRNIISNNLINIHLDYDSTHHLKEYDDCELRYYSKNLDALRNERFFIYKKIL